jgi:protein SCO1/2
MTFLAKTLRDLMLRAGIILAAVTASVALQGAAERAFAADWHGDYFPNVVLTDQDGKQHRFYDDVIKNKVVAVQFFFTSCTDVCPAETAQLRRVYDILNARMGKDIHFYSISIDPERDDQRALKAYSQRFKTGPGWTFLTGSKADVDLLQRKLGLSSGDLKQLRDHSTSIMFGNEKTARWTKRTANDDPVVLANLLGFQLFGQTGPRVASAGSYDKAPEIGEVKPGQFLFRARCASCHRIGGGDDLGPDLAGVTQKRDRAWLSRWIQEPDKMIAEKDPTAVALLAKWNNLRMPNLGLGPVEADAILNYLDEETKKLAAAAAERSRGAQAAGAKPGGK